jgi:integrase
VIAALNSLPPIKRVAPQCFFVASTTKVRTETDKWVRKVKRLNNYVSFTHPKTGEPMLFRSHMLRDTYAVEMLKAGVPLEKVSKLLGHKSITITERYYAKWVPERLRLLEEEAVAVMRRMGAEVSGL